MLECVPQGSDGISKADLEASLGADTVKVNTTAIPADHPLLHLRTRYGRGPFLGPILSCIQHVAAVPLLLIGIVM